MTVRFWFVRSGEVSIREQLVTQVSLSILAGELEAEERLPSIRELARRFSVHPNTVSAGYRQLERERWVEFRRGSGVYVRATAPRAMAGTDAAEQIDRVISGVFAAGRRVIEFTNGDFTGISGSHPQSITTGIVLHLP